MDKKNFTIGILVGVIGLFILIAYYHVSHEEVNRKTEKVYEYIYDTIPYYAPEYRDSVLLRYDTIKVKPENISVSGDTTVATSDESDSVSVVLPITQKIYTDDSTYTAYVSGYEQSLDSILIRNKTIHETVTVNETIIKTNDYPLGVGITAGAGYGLINKKPDVFVGISFYYKIFPRKVKNKRNKSEP